ncbi:MAG: hypothetical protein ACFFAS_16810 [Promethearchaeota archaeon]
MASKNFLSNKKNIKMSFSTSNALMDWIKRYTNSKHRENPTDERYKSVSAFIHSSLEKLMELFQKNKNMDDFERLIDKEVENLYEQLTFKAIIDQTEDSIKFNKFLIPSNEVMKFFLGFRRFVIQGISFGSDIDVFVAIKNIVSRLNNFLRQNKISKGFNVYKIENKYVFEYEGVYENLHYEFSKSVAIIIGLVGFEVISSSYIKNYTRFDCVETELFRSTRYKLKERLNLSYKNVKEFIKYEHIIDDAPQHIWLNAFDSKGSIISFTDVKSGLKFVNSKIELLKKTVEQELIYLKILKMLEHFKWIKIENEDDLSFKFLISKNNNKIEHEIFWEVFQNKIQKKESEYYITA